MYFNFNLYSFAFTPDYSSLSTLCSYKFIVVLEINDIYIKYINNLFYYYFRYSIFINKLLMYIY